VLVALACALGEPAERAEETGGTPGSWQACSVAADCVWTIGEAGWPTAVSRVRESDYLDWVASRAPFTTYFTPDDCFVEPAEFSSYVSRSRSSVACQAGICTLGVEPRCTR
jgi:hypothetical protein